MQNGVILHSTIPSAANTECPICQESYTSGTTEILVCHHYFHHACLSTWVIDHFSNTCPCCRATLYRIKYFPGPFTLEERLARSARIPLELRLVNVETQFKNVLDTILDEEYNGRFGSYIPRLLQYISQAQTLAQALRRYRLQGPDEVPDDFPERVSTLEENFELVCETLEETDPDLGQLLAMIDGRADDIWENEEASDEESEEE